MFEMWYFAAKLKSISSQNPQNQMESIKLFAQVVKVISSLTSLLHTTTLLNVQQAQEETWFSMSKLQDTADTAQEETNKVRMSLVDLKFENSVRLK